jgi:hypothetical protein
MKVGPSGAKTLPSLPEAKDCEQQSEKSSVAASSAVADERPQIADGSQRAYGHN